MHPLRWRIALAYSVLLVVVLTSLAAVLFVLLRTTYVQATERGLAGQAHLVAAVIAPNDQPLVPSPQLATTIQALRAQLDTRITIVSAQGIVVTDSVAGAVGQQVGNRPEIQSALREGQGASDRYSVATGDEMVFVAVPLGEKQSRGVVRLGVPLASMQAAQWRLGVSVFTTAFFAILVASALAPLIARRTTRSLQEMQIMAARLADGDLAVQIPVPRDADVAELAHDFNRMGTRIRDLITSMREAEQSRRTELANISHDLRTPLASLQAMIDTLEDGAFNDEPVARDFLRRMDNEMLSLNHLVGDFLELTSIESGELQLQCVSIDLATLLVSLSERIAPQANARDIHIRLKLSQQLPHIIADVQQIERVVLNVLQNALAYTPAGGTIEIQADEQLDLLHVTVRDTGSGIDPANLPHIFERFYRGDPARSRGGNGLGLAIARYIVERHSGRIWAESSLEHGTTVYIDLPLTPGTVATPR